MTTFVKAYGWENVQSGNVVRGSVHSGKFPLGKCQAGKVAVEELSFGEVPVWDLFIGWSQSWKFPNTNLSVKLSQKNRLKEL